MIDPTLRLTGTVTTDPIPYKNGCVFRYQPEETTDEISVYAPRRGNVKNGEWLAIAGTVFKRKDGRLQLMGEFLFGRSYPKRSS